jgi:hypothetical protein
MLFIVMILGPLLVYVTSSVVRYLSESGLTTDSKLMEVGNVFGMTAVVTLSWLLIPASKSRGPIAILFRWDPILVLQIFHVWSGRIVVIGAIVHGFCHTLRLGMQSPQILWSYLVPPWGCWTNPQTYDPLICQLSDKNRCSCYEHFLFFTGLVATMGLIVIGIFSMYHIRRRFFSTFVVMHHVLTPLTFVLICIHYNRAILYACGSLLYYLAACYPAWIEFLWKRFRHHPVKVVSVEKIDANPCQSHRPCVALTMEASISAIRMYRPGFFGLLSVPSISPVAHPFTVNSVPTQPHRIRIIFRVSGKFTRALEKSLCCNLLSSGEVSPELEVLTTAKNRLPDMFLQGYYGSGNLIERMSNHDFSVVVATGVGITPYLSLLSALIRNDGIDDGTTKDENSMDVARKVVFHWICRDEALIRYCRKEYMQPLLETPVNGSGIPFEINIYLTGSGHDAIVEDEDVQNQVSSNNKEIHLGASNDAHGIPFEHSRYSVGERICANIGYCLIFSLLAWGGLWIVWVWYKKQETVSYVGRLATLVMLVLYEFFAGVVANVCWYLVSKRRLEGWSQVSEIDELEKDGECASCIMDKGKSLGMTPFRDTEGPVTTQASLEILAGGQRRALDIILHDERPSIACLLHGIHEGQSPALFCCVHPSLAKCLNDSIRNSKCSCLPVTVYQETFEI